MKEISNDDDLKNWKPKKIEEKSDKSTNKQLKKSSIASTFLNSLSKPLNKEV